MKKMLYPQLFILIALAVQAQNTERLTGYHKDYYNSTTSLWEYSDSLNFIYSGARGSSSLYNGVYDVRGEVPGVGGQTRFVNQFDASNHVIRQTQQYLDSGTWQNSWLYSYAYNASGRKTHDTTQAWNNNSWEKYYRTDYGYDAHNDTISKTGYSWDSAHQWYYDSRITYQRDNQHRVTREVRESSGATIGSLDTSEITYYAYDAQGNLSQQVRFDPNASNILDSSYIEQRTYDTNHHLKTLRGYSFSNGVRFISSANSYDYTGAGYLSKITLGTIDSTGGYIPYQKSEYAYDAFNVLDTTTNSHYNSAGSSWIIMDFDLNIYDVNNDLVQRRIETNHPVNGWYTSYVQNLQYQNHLVIFDEASGYSNGTLVPSNREYFWYENYISGVSEIASTGWAVYPNPAHDILNIQLPEGNFEALNIYNIKGQSIATERIATGAVRIAIPTNQFEPGIYIVRLSGQENSLTQKLIIE